MDRRYTDSELAEILAGASNRQSGEGQDGWSVEQVYAMAAELGIDSENVRSELAQSSPTLENTVGTTETIPNTSLVVGSPKGLTLRRRMKGELPTIAIEDIAEDAKRSFSRVKRLESRNDELLVEGSIAGADAELTVEAGSKYSVISLSLRFTKIGHWIHSVTQLIALLIAFTTVATTYGASSADFFFAWFLFGLGAFVCGTGISFFVAKSARASAEKAFELQANRAARMLNASSAEPSQLETAKEADSNLNKRLRHEH